MLVVLWGLSGERPLEIVGRELGRLGVPSILVDQRDVLEMEVQLSVGTEVEATLYTPGYAIDLAAVTALYARPYDSCRLPDVARAGIGSPAWDHARAVDVTLTSWSDVTPALVVNRSDPSATNDSKPYQLDMIRRAGFRVPATLITTDPGVARRFWECHGEVIYKSVSSVRSKVARLQLADLDRLADIQACPTQFQQYIPGIDYRVHVVGDEVFASEIVSCVADYRYGGDGQVTMHPFELPRDVADRCVRLAAEIGLVVAGIDLRRNPDGEWYCFEVNPAPAFSFYEDRTGQPIGNAIARLLAAGP
jgi:hypothetical protein